MVNLIYEYSHLCYNFENKQLQDFVFMIDMQHKSLMIALKNNVMPVHVMTSTAKAK